MILCHTKHASDSGSLGPQLFMLAVEKIEAPPVWALSASSCVSTAIKLWCMPVMVMGAYENPKSAPPTEPESIIEPCDA